MEPEAGVGIYGAGMIIYGIDPARGWAITGTEPKRVINCGTVPDIVELIDKMDAMRLLYPPDRVLVEMPPNKKVYPRPGISQFAMLKIAVNVGENRQKAHTIRAYFYGAGIRCDFVNPAGTKMDRRQVESLTGWKGRTSEHSRDAIVLAWIEG